MSKRVIRYFQSPAFPATDWESRNPYLNQGEIGYLLESGVVKRGKVGPGYWNDLPYIGTDIYAYTEAVTNPIGDATGILTNNTSVEILHKMLNPYQPPGITNLGNNGGSGGLYLNAVLKEVGQTVNSPVLVNFTLSNIANVLGATPINVTAGSVFSNEGNFALSLPISLSLAAPLTPSTPSVITIGVRVTHTNGQTSPVYTTISFRPRMMWFSSSLSTIASGATFMAQAGRQELVSTIFKRDYSFGGSGYSWLAVPTMLGPSSPTFTDVTNPNVILNYAMQDAGVISINNGVGTYNYQLYRSTFLLINPTVLRVS